MMAPHAYGWWRAGLLKRRFLIPSLLFLPSILISAVSLPSQDSAGTHVRPLLHAPAGVRPVQINPRGETILPNGRLITPYGRQVTVAPHPYGLAISPDGKTLVTVNSGVHPFSVSILTDLDSLTPKVAQIPPGFKSADADPDSVFMGAAIAPDNRTLYLSEGNNGRVGIFDLATHQRVYSLSVDGEFQGRKYTHSLTADLKVSRDGRFVYVLDLAHFRLVVIDTASKTVISSIGVGRMPFGLALSPDGRRAYVSNVGMFRYSLVPGYDPNDPRRTGLDFPPFGFPSKEAQQGVSVAGRNIPGLGDPNVAESNSLWVIDMSRPSRPSVKAKIPTGLPVGDDSVGGSSPGAVVAGRRRVYVSNSAQDSITVVDARKNRVIETAVLTPASSVHGLRGVLPFGMALSPDERRLYVACAGINAVAVIDAVEVQFIGYIPTAWFPARVATSPDGQELYVANAKGFGSGPNGGANFHPGPEGTYIGDITKGTVSVLNVPKDYALRPFTLQVLENNGFVGSIREKEDQQETPRPPDFPIPGPGKSSSKIRYVVYVVKENRTFDEVFGDLAGPDVEGEPALARWGEDATVSEEQALSVEHVRVTPNHHALARRFAISDNFYVDSDVSADGHHWLVGVYPNEVMETAWPAAYGQRLEFEADPDAPGRLALGGTSLRPETYLESGSLWEHLARHKISFRNYGEGLELPGTDEGKGELPMGSRQSVNAPLPQALFENTSRSFPTFNTNISDQYRFAQFRQEFEVRYAGAKEPLPQLIFIWLPNDHTADPRPEDGFRYRASYVADNDLALGKLVELLSHSPFWPEMAIFVTEDDAQGGQDHADAHRSVLMVISPYARKGVSHVHTSIASIIKTVDLIFGLPYLNQYDAAATDLADMFTATPDFTPYDAVPSDTRIFDPEKVREPGLEILARPGAPLDDPATIRREMRDQLERARNK
jgi:YVTN family beta-propeller protein